MLQQAVGTMSPPAQLRLLPALTLRGFGSQENEERQQKIIQMEFSLWQETGEKVPQSLTPEQWKNLYNLPSRCDITHVPDGIGTAYALTG